jgi:hypothetical protein
VHLTQENHVWGYERIVSAVMQLGNTLSGQTVGNIHNRHGYTRFITRKVHLAGVTSHAEQRCMRDRAERDDDRLAISTPWPVSDPRPRGSVSVGPGQEAQCPKPPLP